MENVVEKGDKIDDVAVREPSPVDYSEISWKPEEEKTLLRRIDLRVLPGLALLYLLCFLDRT